MFVRIARFEGGTADGIDERIEEINSNLAEGAGGGMPPGRRAQRDEPRRRGRPSLRGRDVRDGDRPGDRLAPSKLGRDRVHDGLRRLGPLLGLDRNRERRADRFA